MKTLKHLRKYAIVVLVMAIVLFGIYYVGYTRNTFSVFDRAIGERIESWDRYKPTNEVIGKGTCKDGKEFGNVIEEINKRPRRLLHFRGGLKLMITENAQSWTNFAFRNYPYALYSQCTTSNGFVPVRVYRDKLLWRSMCTSEIQNSTFSPCRDVQNLLETWERDFASSDNIFNEAGIHYQTPEYYYQAINSYPNDDYYRFALYPNGSLYPHDGYKSNSGASLFIPRVASLDIKEIEQMLGLSLAVFDSDKATQISVGGRQGKRITEEVQADPNHYPVHGELILEMYPVPYSNAPVILRYYHADGDDLMEPYIKMMHDTWKFDE